MAKMSKTGQDLMILCDIGLFPLTESLCYQHAEMATGRSEVLNQVLKATSPPEQHPAENFLIQDPT